MTGPRRSLNLGMDRFSGLYIWAFFIILFGIWTPHLFLTRSTLDSVASSQAVVAMLAIAVVLPLAAGVFDLSVGATINFSTVFCVWLQTVHNWNMWPAMIAAIAVCAVIGVINGFIVVKLHVSAFIATLGAATIITAFQTIVSGQSQPLPPSASAWSTLTQFQVFGIQIVFVYLIVLALLFWWLLEHTPAGRYIYATGGNSDAARLSGVATGRWVWLSLIASSVLAGLAGVLYGSLFGPSLTYGQSLLLPAYAAAFLGSTQLKPGRFNVWGTVLAVYVLATGVQGLEYITSVQWLNDMFNGVALIAAVSFTVWRQRTAGERRRQDAARSSREAPDTGQQRSRSESSV